MKNTPIIDNTTTTPWVSSVTLKDDEDLTSDDAAWALNSAFLILTMQTGFAMLECGSVSTKNSASIMIKNCIDVTVGGLSYWTYGYGLTFGEDHPNPFVGVGKWFFTSPVNSPKWGSEYSHYFFHFSFASTATTIVSGAVAERMNLWAYIIFTFYNTAIYCIPACWAWNANGWLAKRGFFDFAGTCIVHYGGGVSAFVAAYMLGPRLNRYDMPGAYSMSSPMTTISGMFMLWWAWMSFNAGSTFGVAGNLWKVSALAAVTTLNAGIGGGIVGILMSMAMNKGKLIIGDIVNAILGALVAITGICPIVTPTESIIIGAVGALIAVAAVPFVNYLKVDDPVGAVAVHCFAAMWGTLCVGIFAKDVTSQDLAADGILHGGGTGLLVTQTIGLLAVTAWAGVSTAIGMFMLDKTIGIRTKMDEEILGADWCHHEIFDQEWCHELYTYVVDKLKHGNVDEAVAAKIMGQMKKRLTPDIVERIQSRMSTLPTRSRKVSFYHESRSPGSSNPTPDPEQPSFPAAETSSHRGSLHRIMQTQESPQPLPRRRILGAMNAPLYQSFKDDLEHKIVVEKHVVSRAANQSHVVKSAHKSPTASALEAEIMDDVNETQLDELDTLALKKNG